MKMTSKPTPNVFALLVIGVITSSLVSCTALARPPAPAITPTNTATITPTTTPKTTATVTLTPSPIATNTPTDQELLEALDERTRIIFHKPASEVIDFLLEIQASVRTDNKEKLASMIHYPITVYGFDGDNDKEIQNAAEFVTNYEKIVTPEWRDIILAQEPARLFTNWQGAMVHRGELWFAAYCLDKSCDKTKLYIITINHTDR